MDNDIEHDIEHLLAQFRVFTDPRDGRVYRTVKIGSQTWMAENLAFDCPESKCYGDDPKNAEIYGRLYNWETAKKAVPPGWHLPSDAEWQELVDFVGGSSTAGTKLKAASGWKENGNGTDKYGFSALPGGYGYSNGSFNYVGFLGYWWSATEDTAYYAYSRYMYDGDEYVIWDYDDKTSYFSVRCLRDDGGEQ